MRGEWSLPGGALETGETMLEGVTREVLEETGLRVKPLELLAMLDRISRDESGAVEFHYVLLDWLCELAETTQMDEARAGSDALEIAWMSEETLLAMTEMDDASRRVSLDALKRMEARG